MMKDAFTEIHRSRALTVAAGIGMAGGGIDLIYGALMERYLAFSAGVLVFACGVLMWKVARRKAPD
jgi:hypothetical protein